MTARTRTSASSTQGEQEKPWWQRVTIIANIIFIVAAIGAAIHFGKSERFVELLTQLDPWWIALAVLLQVATYFCIAGLLVVVLRFFSRAVSVRTVAGLSIAKLFIDQVIPTLGVGGSLMVLHGFTKRNIARGEGMAALVTEVISRWIAYFILFVLALVLLWYQQDVTKAVRYIAIGFSVLFVLVLSALIFTMWAAKRRKLPAWMKRIHFLKPVFESLREIPNRALKSKKLWIISFVLQALIFILDAATLWACLRALGTDVSPLAAFISFMLASAIATISLVPGGLGFFDGVAIGVLASLGVSFEAAIASTILLRGFTYWIPMIPGALIFRKEFAHQHKK